MLEHTYLAAKNCPHFNAVYIATDSEEIASHMAPLGAPVFLTSPACLNGTERVLELRSKKLVTSDVWVLWQADEPFVTPDMIDDLLQNVENKAAIWTLKKSLSREEALNPNVVKVVTRRNEEALYFSRSLIPYDRDGINPPTYKHVGLYAYGDAALGKIEGIPIGQLARAENLEQLTFLEEGIPIYVHETEGEAIGIDTPHDFAKALVAILEKK